MEELTTDKSTLKYKLNKEWTIWSHLPHDTNWTEDSYKKLMDITYVEEIISLYETISDKLIKNCMLFIMRRGIKPIWEDPQNREGGCFSFKINNKNIIPIWKRLTYALLGENISKNADFRNNVNGITISPKKNFCIIKIWLKDCKINNNDDINLETGLPIMGCLFKKHLIDA